MTCEARDVTEMNNRLGLDPLAIYASAQRIQNVTSLDAVVSTGFDELARYGVKHITYHLFPGYGSVETQPASRFYARNIPDSVIEFYTREFSRNFDPIINQVFRLHQGLWISDAKALIGKESETVLDYIDETISLFGDGFALPLFGPNNLRGYIFLGTGKAKSDFLPSFAWQISNLCTSLHTRYGHLKARLQTEIQLTTREFDILELVVMGRTNREIGNILGISTHTVDSYMRRIFLKLGTTDRVTTSLKAMNFGLLMAVNPKRMTQKILPGRATAS